MHKVTAIDALLPQLQVVVQIQTLLAVVTESDSEYAKELQPDKKVD